MVIFNWHHWGILIVTLHPSPRGPTKDIPLRKSSEGDPSKERARQQSGVGNGDGECRRLSEILPNAISSPPMSGNSDWHGLRLNEKLLRILGPKEIAGVPRWLERAKLDPDVIGEIMDNMHAAIREGKIIKNPGSYAEHLWKVSRGAASRPQDSSLN
jgi:hypothetical protein